MLVFNKYFYKSKKSKLYFGDRVPILNDFIYQTGRSTLTGCFYMVFKRRMSICNNPLGLLITRIQIICNIPEFLRHVSNAKMWISKFLNGIECLIKI
jgi:hypothetical protein